MSGKRVVSRIGAAFVLGAVLGACAVMMLTSKMLDQLYLQRDQLQNQISFLEEDVRNLQVQLSQKNASPTVQKVLIRVDHAPDGFTETELIKKLQQETKFLVGKKIESLDEHPEILFHLLDGKSYLINEREVTIKIKAVTIGITTRFWVDLSVTSPRPVL